MPDLPGLKAQESLAGPRWREEMLAKPQLKITWTKDSDFMEKAMVRIFVLSNSYPTFPGAFASPPRMVLLNQEEMGGLGAGENEKIIG